MEAGLEESFESLLDSDYQSHIIEVMHEWCGDTHRKLNAKRADLVHDEISAPLLTWISERHNNGIVGNYTPANVATVRFADEVNNLIYILRHATRPLYPEHINSINDAWSYFQRSIAYELQVKNRILTEYIHADLPNHNQNIPKEALMAAVNEELNLRFEREKIKHENDERDRITTRQEKWAAGARKYKKEDEGEWLKAGILILERDTKLKIKSIRSLANEIIKVTGCKKEALETIRKTSSIKDLIHFRRAELSDSKKYFG